MKVKAIKNELTDEELEIYFNYTNKKENHRTNHNIKIDDIMDVWYIGVTKSKKGIHGNCDEFGEILYANHLGEFEKSVYFEIIEGAFPTNWIMGQISDINSDFQFVIGPIEIFGANPLQALYEIQETAEGAQKWYEYVVKTKRARGENPYTVLKENITL